MLKLISLICIIISAQASAEKSDNSKMTLPVGHTVTGRTGETYTILKPLSSGAEGVTYIARDSSGRKICLKSSNPTPQLIIKSRWEAEWLRVMHQRAPRNFPEIYEYFDATGRDVNGVPAQTNFIAMHLFTGYKELKDFVSEYDGPLPPRVATKVLRQIVEICASIHQRQTGGKKRKKKYMYHGDLNNKNVLVNNEGHVVFLDPQNNPAKLQPCKNAKEAIDMHRVASHALLLAAGETAMSLNDIREKHTGVYNFIARCLGEMLEGFDHDQEISGGDLALIPRSTVTFWFKRRKKKVIASATDMLDFMHQEDTYKRDILKDWRAEFGEDKTPTAQQLIKFCKYMTRAGDDYFYLPGKHTYLECKTRLEQDAREQASSAGGIRRLMFEFTRQFGC